MYVFILLLIACNKSFNKIDEPRDINESVDIKNDQLKDNRPKDYDSKSLKELKECLDIIMNNIKTFRDIQKSTKNIYYNKDFSIKRKNKDLKLSLKGSNLEDYFSAFILKFLKRIVKTDKSIEISEFIKVITSDEFSKIYSEKVDPFNTSIQIINKLNLDEKENIELIGAIFACYANENPNSIYITYELMKITDKRTNLIRCLRKALNMEIKKYEIVNTLDDKNDCSYKILLEEKDITDIIKSSGSINHIVEIIVSDLISSKTELYRSLDGWIQQDELNREEITKLINYVIYFSYEYFKKDMNSNFKKGLNEKELNMLPFYFDSRETEDIRRYCLEEMSKLIFYGESYKHISIRTADLFLKNERVMLLKEFIIKESNDLEEKLKLERLVFSYYLSTVTIKDYVFKNIIKSDLVAPESVSIEEIKERLIKIINKDIPNSLKDEILQLNRCEFVVKNNKLYLLSTNNKDSNIVYTELKEINETLVKDPAENFTKFEILDNKLYISGVCINKLEKIDL